MMMQARERVNRGYNNGFRKNETKLEYQARLRTAAQFIAYHIANNPIQFNIREEDTLLTKDSLSLKGSSFNNWLLSDLVVDDAALADSSAYAQSRSIIGDATNTPKTSFFIFISVLRCVVCLL